MRLLEGVQAAAQVSGCGQFRWWLARWWDTSLPRACFVMLNPSDAAADVDDPTVRACVEFAKTAGCGGFYVVNLYAWRSPEPAALAAAGYPVGENNDSFLAAVARRCASTGAPVICAWGAKAQPERAAEVLRLLRRLGVPLSYLRLTKEGHPSHPLARGRGFIPRDTKPTPWSCSNAES